MNDLMEVDTTNDLVVDVAAMEATLQRFVVADKISTAMCRASILPAHLRTRKVDGKYTDLDPEEVKANCVLIVNQALRWGVDPFAILPSTFVIGGNLGFDGKLIAAIVNKLGGLERPLRYEFFGKGADLGVRVIGKFRGVDDEKTVEVSLKQAKTDNEIWLKDPEQKLCYTGATRWARRHCPHVILGILSDDSPVDTIDAVVTTRTAKPAIDHDSKSTTSKIDEIATDFHNRIEETNTTEEMERLAERIGAELALPSDVRSGLIDTARQKYKLLANHEKVDSDITKDSQSPAFKNWSRTLKTTKDKDQIVGLTAQIDSDEGIDTDDKAALAKLASELIKSLK